ncbi:MAG TPA: hypothetical protein VH643_36935 [Gemmataceae bacterium]|jgi:hypothetical protein
MNTPIREPNDYDAERVLPWTLVEPPEPEQAMSAETRIAAVQWPGGFVVVVLRALSAWPT